MADSETKDSRFNGGGSIGGGGESITGSMGKGGKGGKGGEEMPTMLCVQSGTKWEALAGYDIQLLNYY